VKTSCAESYGTRPARRPGWRHQCCPGTAALCPARVPAAGRLFWAARQPCAAGARHRLALPPLLGIMAGYPVHRRAGASTAMLMARNGHHVNPLARTPGVGSDGFMNVSPLVQADDNPWYGHWLLRRANIQRARQPDIGPLPNIAGLPIADWTGSWRANHSDMYHQPPAPRVGLLMPGEDAFRHAAGNQQEPSRSLVRPRCLAACGRAVSGTGDLHSRLSASGPCLSIGVKILPTRRSGNDLH
jgi:hypothetical protein